MSLKDTLSFRGSDATQLLRDQHVVTVEISEAFLANGADISQILTHVDYTIEVHFRLEDEILLPALTPYLQRYLEFLEPIRIITGEHMSIRSLYRSLSSVKSFETEDPVATEEEVHAGSEKLAKIMLQHIFKEENGLFPMADSYIPDKERNQIQISMQQKLESLHNKYLSDHDSGSQHSKPS